MVTSYRGTVSAMARTPDIGETRGEYLRVRLAPSEIQHLDAIRGEQSRSEFVRDRINLPPACKHPHETAHHHG